MADAVTQPASKRYALITGANKGIGFAICRQLASKGIVVILAARDEKRGIEAQQKLIKEFGFDNVVFHQLDVADPLSVAAIFEFIKAKFGRLDILVNNAAILGAEVAGDVSVVDEYINKDISLILANRKPEAFQPKASGKFIETLEWAEKCIETNYYGAKRVAEALIPLLQLSDSPRIVNVSSTLGSLVLQPNKWAKGVFSSKDCRLTEERIDEVVSQFVKDFKEGKVQENEWPPYLAAYKVSKEALNAYTWIAAQKYPSLLINSVCPGYTRSDITSGHGILSEMEGAQAPISLALLPHGHGGPSGNFYFRSEALALLL